MTRSTTAVTNPDAATRLHPILLALVRDDGLGRPLTAHQLQTLDWAQTLRDATAQGVASLVYQRLRQTGQIDCLPAEVIWALRKAHDQAWVKNLLHLQTLEQVLAVLAAEGIRPILLKGAGLIATVYGEPALRPTLDVDLLVAPDQFRQALHVLLHAGGHPTHGEQFDGAYELVTHHVGLIFDETTGVLVELHHQWLSVPVKQASLVPVAELRSRAQPVQIGPTSADVLCAEDQVLHLSGHMAVHSPAVEKLIWYYDVDQVVRHAQPPLDWAAVLDRAQRYGLVLPLQWVLPVVAHELGTPVPNDVLAQLAALPVSAAERQRFGAAALGPHSRLGDGLQKLAGLEGTAARLRFAWQIAFPAWDYMRALYPNDGPARLVGRYPRRWAEVVGEYVAVSRRSR